MSLSYESNCRLVSERSHKEMVTKVMIVSIYLNSVSVSGMNRALTGWSEIERVICP